MQAHWLNRFDTIHRADLCAEPCPQLALTRPAQREFLKTVHWTVMKVHESVRKVHTMVTQNSMRFIQDPPKQPAKFSQQSHLRITYLRDPSSLVGYLTDCRLGLAYHGSNNSESVYFHINECVSRLISLCGLSDNRLCKNYAIPMRENILGIFYNRYRSAGFITVGISREL